jgi:hypothetical protein
MLAASSSTLPSATGSNRSRRPPLAFGNAEPDPTFSPTREWRTLVESARYDLLTGWLKIRIPPTDPK